MWRPFVDRFEYRAAAVDTGAMRIALALLLAAVALPATARADAFPRIPLAFDHLRLMAGVGTDFEHGGRYIGEVGWMSLLGQKWPYLGPVIGFAADGASPRISAGVHVDALLRGGPEFVYRQVEGVDEFGAALALGFEIPIFVVAAGVGGRVGYTDAGPFGELGLTFVLRIPLGTPEGFGGPPPDACTSDRDCAATGRHCDPDRRVCAQCVTDDHCGPQICRAGQCFDIEPISSAP